MPFSFECLARREFGPDATQDLRKAFEYFIMMAGTMKEPTLKNIAGKSLRSTSWAGIRVNSFTPGSLSDDCCEEIY